MFRCLKYAVREIFADRFEILFYGSEMALASILKQKFELRAMQLKSVHLLVTQHITANHRAWIGNRPPHSA